MAVTTNSPTPFIGGARTIDGDELNKQFSFPVTGSEDGVTAFATGGQTNATPLTAKVCRITTVANAADSVLLRSALPGRSMTLINSGANSMQVFGKGTDTINGVATATGVAQAANAVTTYYCVTAGAWFK